MEEKQEHIENPNSAKQSVPTKTKRVPTPREAMAGYEDEAENAEDDTKDDFFETITIEVDAGQVPMRLDKFLDMRLQHSRSKLQKAIRTGAVQINGWYFKSNYKVKPGDKVSVHIAKPFTPDQRVYAQPIPLDIRYEDEHILILHKPPGMVCHPGVGNWTGTLVNGLAYYFGDNTPNLEASGYQRVGLTHRIDKDTSGLLVIAKTDTALKELAHQFFHHTIDRTYYALVWGDVEKDKGTVTGYIGRDEHDRQSFIMYPENEKHKGKWSVTHYEVVERFYYTTLIKCNLETGRTHQIRVHMNSLGHPLFNDYRYGGDVIKKGTLYSKYRTFVQRVFDQMPRQALHAKSLGFIHPGTGEYIHFDSELPDDFLGALASWRSYIAQRQATMNSKYAPVQDNDDDDNA